MLVVGDEFEYSGVVATGNLLDDLRERPVGDPLSVGEAPTDDDARARVDRGEQLAREPRLAHARWAQHGDKSARFLLRAALERLLERGELGLSPDERSVQSAGVGRNVRKDVEEAPGKDRFGLPFDGKRLDLLDPNRIAHEAEGRVPDQDLAGTRGLLQARRHVDGVPGRERVSQRRVAGDDLAGVDAHSHRDSNAPVAL